MSAYGKEVVAVNRRITWLTLLPQTAWAFLKVGVDHIMTRYVFVVRLDDLLTSPFLPHYLVNQCRLSYTIS